MQKSKKTKTKTKLLTGPQLQCPRGSPSSDKVEYFQDRV